jgi:hypothetical protein
MDEILGFHDLTLRLWVEWMNGLHAEAQKDAAQSHASPLMALVVNIGIMTGHQGHPSCHFF